MALKKPELESERVDRLQAVEQPTHVNSDTLSQTVGEGVGSMSTATDAKGTVILDNAGDGCRDVFGRVWQHHARRRKSGAERPVRLHALVIVGSVGKVNLAVQLRQPREGFALIDI